MSEKLQLQQVAIEKKDPKWLKEYQAGVFEPDDQAMNYRIYLPQQMAENNEKLPLVIWLHGVKGRGEDNRKQLLAGNSFGPAFFADPKVQSEFPMVVLVPQCPMGKFWINFRNNKSRKPLKAAIDLIRLIATELPIDTSRIYLGGQSMGGFATWTALTENPEIFAAAIAVCGGGSERRAKKKIQAPVWAFHGVKDPLVDVERTRKMVAALKKAEKSVIYTEYALGKHNIWPSVFAEEGLLPWLQLQKRADQPDLNYRSQKSGALRFLGL